MGGFGTFFKTLLITFSAALITYNVIISANVPLKLDFPGPKNPFSSSSLLYSSVDPVIKLPNNRKSNLGSSQKRLFHTAVTASDSVYNTWQCRVMYYWFKKFQNQPGSEMGGFTRILHSGKPDKHMDEIPTFVAQPLPAGMDQVIHCFIFHVLLSSFHLFMFNVNSGSCIDYGLVYFLQYLDV